MRAGRSSRGSIAEYPNISAGVAPGRADDDWSWVVSRLRHGLEYLRYQHRLFDDTPKLRDTVARAHARAVRRAGRCRRPLRAMDAASGRSGTAVARAIDAGRSRLSAPTSRRTGPTSCSSRRSSLSDRRRSTTCAPRDRSAFPRRSASGAGIICPARRSFASCPIACSSGTTRRSSEARELHGVPGAADCRHRRAVLRQVVRPPARRAIAQTFCRQIGLPARPSDPALRVLGAVHRQPARSAVRRRLDPAHPDARGSSRLRDTPILVRPHPSRRRRVGGRRSDAVRRRGACGAATRSMPHARADYFDSLYHSAVVVGLNTSAFIEAGILGRPVLHHPAARVAREPDGHGALQIPVRGRRRTADERDQLRRAPATARRGAGASVHGDPAVRPRVRAAARTRRARRRRSSSSRSRR